MRKNKGVTLISLIITSINIYEGFNSTDINKIKLMKTLGANKNQIYFIFNSRNIF